MRSQRRRESWGVPHLAGGRRPRLLSTRASPEGCSQRGSQRGVTETENDQEGSQCALRPNGMRDTPSQILSVTEVSSGAMAKGPPKAVTASCGGFGNLPGSRLLSYQMCIEHLPTSGRRLRNVPCTDAAPMRSPAWARCPPNRPRV